MTVPRSPTVAGSNRSPRNGRSVNGRAETCARRVAGHPAHVRARHADTSRRARREQSRSDRAEGEPRRLCGRRTTSRCSTSTAWCTSAATRCRAPRSTSRAARTPACSSPSSPTTPPGRPTTVAAHLRELGVDAADERRRHLRPGRRAAAERAAARRCGGLRHRRRGPAGRAARAGLRPVQDPTEEPAAVVSGFHADLRWSTVIAGAILVRDGLPWVASNTDLTVPTPRRARARATARWSAWSRGSPSASRWSPASRSRRCSRRRCAGSAASGRWSSATGWTPTSRAPTGRLRLACW